MKAGIHPSWLLFPTVRVLLLLAMFCTPGCALIEKLPPLPTPGNLRKAEQQKMSLARLSEERGNVADARHIYEDVLKRNYNHQEAHRRLAVVATIEGKYAEADQHFHKAWEIGPQSPALMCDMGYRLYLEHRLAESEQLLRQAVAADPQNSKANNNLGLVLGQQNRMDEAMQCFRKVNSEAESHANLAYVLTQMGRNDEARFHFNQALTLDKNMRSAANGLLALTGNLNQMPKYVPAAPPAPQNAPMIAGMPSQGPMQPSQAPPTQQTNGSWQPLAVQESHPPLNPQPPSQVTNWQVPAGQTAAAQPNYGPGYGPNNGPPLVPGQGALGQQAGAQQSPAGYSAQPAAYWSGTPGPVQPAYYQGSPAPYGGMQAGGRVPADPGPMSIPRQFSNGISPQASTVNMPQ